MSFAALQANPRNSPSCSNRRGSSHDQEVQKLHEEMENQIRLEKERIAEEVLAAIN